MQNFNFLKQFEKPNKLIKIVFFIGLLMQYWALEIFSKTQFLDYKTICILAVLSFILCLLLFFVFVRKETLKFRFVLYFLFFWITFAWLFYLPYEFINYYMAEETLIFEDCEVIKKLHGGANNYTPRFHVNFKGRIKFIDVEDAFYWKCKNCKFLTLYYKKAFYNGYIIVNYDICK